MPVSADIEARLRALERIIASASPSLRRADADPADLWLASLPIDRVAKIAEELTGRTDHEVDLVDALAMRLLLKDYTIAVAQLRAILHTTEQRLSSAAPVLREGPRLLARLADEDREERPPIT
jgi:hypothetical protein